MGPAPLPASQWVPSRVGKALPAILILALLQTTQITYAYWHYQQYHPNSQQQQQSSPQLQLQQQPQQAQQQLPPQNGFIGPLQIQDQEQRPSHQLQIQPPKPSQSHRNEMQYTESSQLSQRSTPSISDGLVFNLRATPINATSVKLVWNVFASQQADYFDVRWGPIPEALHSFAEKLNGTVRDHIITNLQPDTQYQFEVHGVQDGFRFRPILALVRMPPLNYIKMHPQDYANPDIVPLGVRADARSTNSIQLSWTDKERPGSFRNSSKLNIIRYYITNQLINSTENAPLAPQYHFVNYTNLRDTRIVLQKLKPATEYAFAVKTAYYSPDMKRVFTQSTFSMDTVAKTFDIEPSPPKNFSIQLISASQEELLTGQSDKLELTWLPPDSPNGALKGYLILYAHDRNASDEQWIRIEVNGANINNWYVTKLKPGSSYYFKLRAVNQKGQSGDSEIRLFVAPAIAPSPAPEDRIINQPIPPNNLLLIVIICLVFILFILFLLVSLLACRTRRKPRKGSIQNSSAQHHALDGSSGNSSAPNSYATNNLSSTVTARVGTLARRRDQSSKPDFWISTTDQRNDGVDDMKSEKSNTDLNMAMVSIQRDSPQYPTTQLFPSLPEYRFDPAQQQQLVQQLQQQQQQSHYHPSQLAGTLNLDQMDSATASALMTLSKRQQQQYQKYQMSGQPFSMGPPGQIPSPHQQPPPPPPLNIEQQQQQQQSQPLYGTHRPMTNNRGMGIQRSTLYDPVSGSFVQNAESGPPNYNSSVGMQGINQFGTMSSGTLQYHPHQTSTLMSRRSANTMRSFQTYGKLGGPINSTLVNQNQFGRSAIAPGSMDGPGVLQSQQVNPLNSNSSYPSLPLKHVSAVRPQIMSSLEDQIEMELAEKEAQILTGVQQQENQQVSQRSIK